MEERDLPALVETIGGELGWNVWREPEHWANGRRLVSGEDMWAEVGFRLGVYGPERGRLIVSGVAPTSDLVMAPVFTGQHTITLNPDREPVSLAKEIRRRVMEPYVADLGDWLETVADVRAKQARRDAYRDRLAQVLGVADDPYRRSNDGVRWDPAGSSAWADFSVRAGSDRVSVDIYSLSQEQAMTIALVLTTL